jgi:hypothetical protein
MKDREKWMELCRQASIEQDPKKLLELTAEIIRLQDEKEIGSFIGPPNQKAISRHSSDIRLRYP